jgi:hypothetical protein
MIRIIDDTEFGQIKVTFRRNSRNITIRVLPDAKVQISAPARASATMVLGFLESRRDWARNAMEKFRNNGTKNTIFTPETEFKTREHTLELAKAPRGDVFVEVKNGKTRVVVPMDNNWEEAQIQQLIRKAITETLRIEAHRYLPKKLNELVQKHGFSVKNLRIKNMKSRWGSCTSKTHMNLNLNLMLLPDHLIEHVLLHELCHTKVMNHGPEFHALMLQLNPMSKVYDREIRKYSPTVF